MAGKALVAYATKYGSTKEVAEAVGETLREQGLEAEVRPARDVVSLDGYDAVVPGTPLYIGSMLKDAKHFLDKHQTGLLGMPVAVFMMGPTSAADDMSEARAQIEKALEKWDWFKPVDVEMFVGAYDPAKLRGLDKLVLKMPATPLAGKTASDDRDWDAIRAWAAALPDKLGTGAVA